MLAYTFLFTDKEQKLKVIMIDLLIEGIPSVFPGATFVVEICWKKIFVERIFKAE